MYDFSKTRVGVKTLEDAVLELGNFAKNVNNSYTNKFAIMKAMGEANIEELRAISNYFYRTNGIYQKVCNYFATMYRYDWHIEPEIFNVDENKQKTVLKDFSKILNYLDNSHLQKICTEIALHVIVDGVYYGYALPTDDCITLQQLPPKYCRSRYSVGNVPVVEFNMRYFDTFTDISYRMKVLKMFPAEFAQGYKLFKQNKLLDENGKPTSWFLLEANASIKIALYNGMDMPLFVSAIPAILDLDASQDIDRRKQMQNLLKIIVQQLPLDKNDDLVFDVEEARDIHNNAVQMLQRAIGVDVLTTFTDVKAIDLSDTSSNTAKDNLERAERTVYNALGTSKNLFNTDGNLSLEKSILEDEGSIRALRIQLEILFDRMVQLKNPNRKKYKFRFYMLDTTQYNYKEMSKLYKEQTQLGFSKMLPQIALGHSQSSIINAAYFENEILNLNNIMIPPMSSNTMSAEALATIGETKSPGRPEKDESEKSDKTIQNEESMS